MAYKQEKPNVVVCLCDQLRAFEVGCYGNPLIRTPNIDRLAEHGVRFDIACSNNPVCSPGRSILLSGQYGRTCMGMLGNVGEPTPERQHLLQPTLPEMFRHAGYRTGLVGKWHMQPLPTEVGFDFAVYPRVAHRYTGQTYIDTNGNETVIEDFAPAHELHALEQFVCEEREEPFFLYYNISQPHMPVFDAPEHYKTMYRPDGVPLRENVWNDGRLARDENWFRIYAWDFLYYQHHLPYTEELPDGFDLRDLTALYYGMTTWVDDQLGQLMHLLEANGIAENTIVLFTSDHGDNLGSHHLFNKDQLYEESIRIPMIVHWPGGLDARCITSQVASLVDVMPTLLRVAGIQAPATVQGTDLSRVVTGDAQTAGENAAFIETSPGDVGVRTLTHLCGINKAKDGKRRTAAIRDPDYMFFDLSTDPLQENNLAKTGKGGEAASGLRERLIRWDRDTPWLNTGR